MKVLRWALTAPAAVAAWYAIFFIGILAHPAIERAICPAGEMISGACINENVQRILDGVIAVFVALSAVAVVSAAVATAPSHKAVVAWVVFCAGGLLAVFFSVATHLYVAGIAALASGLATAAVIRNNLRRKKRGSGAVAAAAT